MTTIFALLAVMLMLALTLLIIPATVLIYTGNKNYNRGMEEKLARQSKPEKQTESEQVKEPKDEGDKKRDKYAFDELIEYGQKQARCGQMIIVFCAVLCLVGFVTLGWLAYRNPPESLQVINTGDQATVELELGSKQATKTGIKMSATVNVVERTITLAPIDSKVSTIKKLVVKRINR